MNRIFRRIDKTFTFIEDWTLFLSVVIALVVAMANVVLRKLTSEVNLYWSDEIVRKVIYLSTYFGCIVAIRNRSLVRIDALPQIFPVLRKPLSLLSHVVVLIFAATMVWLGSIMTHSAFNDTYQRTASLQIPEWIFYLVLPVMGTMMFIRTLMIMAEELRSKPDA